MRSNYKELGEYIQEVKRRNINLNVNELLGLSTQKEFRTSISNIIGTDLSTYKVISYNHFVYMPVTDTWKGLAVALYRNNELKIVSQIYKVFKILNESQLDPEYLMMWFRRPEIDRYARFMSHGSAREIFGWDEMCNTRLPIPSISKQRKIVKEYNVIQNRIVLNQQLIQKLEEIAHTIYKQWFVDFEFPNESGKPYKSSGGEMVFDGELGREIPRGWKVTNLGDISDVKTGPFGSALLNEQYITGGTPVITVEHIKNFEISNLDYPSVNEEDAKRLRTYSLQVGDIIFSRVGSVDLSAIVRPANHGWLFSSRMLRLRPEKSKVHPILLSYYLRLPETRKLIISLSVGSTMASINTKILKSIPFYSYPIQIGDMLAGLISKIDKHISICHQENQKLFELRDLLLSKLATIES